MLNKGKFQTELPFALFSIQQTLLFSCQFIDQIVGKFQIFKAAMLLDEMGCATDPAFSLQCSEDTADLLFLFLSGQNADGRLDTDATQNGEFIGILFQVQVLGHTCVLLPGMHHIKAQLSDTVGYL